MPFPLSFSLSLPLSLPLLITATFLNQSLLNLPLRYLQKWEVVLEAETP